MIVHVRPKLVVELRTYCWAPPVTKFKFPLNDDTLIVLMLSEVHVPVTDTPKLQETQEFELAVTHATIFKV